jgi:hypothetical protein
MPIKTIAEPANCNRVRKRMWKPWQPPEREPRRIKQWLSPEDFKKMEGVGREITEEIRASINDTMDLVASGRSSEQPPDDKATRAKRRAIHKARQSLEKAKQDLQAVGEASIVELWSVADKLQCQTRRRGAPKKFQHVDTFIVLMASHFQRAGGVASAASQATPSDDDRPSATRHVRTSPFLNFLKFAHSRLPMSQQALNPNALCERAHRLLEERRNYWIVAAFLAPHMPAVRGKPANLRELYDAGFAEWQAKHCKTKLAFKQFRRAALDLGFSDAGERKGQK